MGSIDLLEEVSHWGGQSLRVHNPPYFQFTFCFVILVEDVVSQLPGPVITPDSRLPCLTAVVNIYPSGTISYNKYFLLQFSLGMVFYHSHIKLVQWDFHFKLVFLFIDTFVSSAVSGGAVKSICCSIKGAQFGSQRLTREAPNACNSSSKESDARF